MPTNAELDYIKIRDAMDLATEQLRKKEEKDALKSKSEQSDSKEKLDTEKKNKMFKWIAYSAAILIGLIIIIIVIIVIVRMSSSSSSYKPQIKETYNHKPFQLYQVQPPPRQNIPVQQPAPIFPVQQPAPMPIFPVQQPAPMPIFPIQQPQTSLPSSLPLITPSYQNNTSSFNFPSNNSSFFNKLDNTSSLFVKKGGRKNK
jgi:hypothetical protein